MQTHLTIIIERSDISYSAYAPDLQGRTAAHKTLRGVKTNMKEAIAIHIEGMSEDGSKIAMSEQICFKHLSTKESLGPRTRKRLG